MDLATRRFMESRLGHDFSRVRIHADVAASRAASLFDARAFTINNDIVFAAGEYAPLAESGRQLLSHELAHVIQQRRGMPATTKPDALERQADDHARAALQSPAARGGTSIATGRSSGGAHPTIQLQSKQGHHEAADDEIKKIAKRIEQIYWDMDTFLQVWSTYNPDRSTLSTAQELSLQTWLTADIHKGWQESWLRNDFYKFLAYYPVTFKADPKFSPPSVKQQQELVNLQMYLDARRKDDATYMAAWAQYDRKKLTGKQKAFLQELVKAGFTAESFFSLLEGGFYH